MEHEAETARPEVPIRSRLVGVRSSSGPLEDVGFRLGDGVTALYGKNGAGKSWCLRSLRDALTGIRGSDCHVIVSVNPDSMDWVFPGIPEFWQRSNAELKESRLREWLLPRQVVRGDSSTSFEPSSSLLDALTRSHHLALKPTGTGDPRWDVWLCIDPGHDPVLRAEVEHVVRIMNDLATLRAASESLREGLSNEELEGHVALRPESRAALVAYGVQLRHLIATADTGDIPEIIESLLQNWERFERSPDHKLGLTHRPAADLIETLELYLLWVRHAVCASWWENGTIDDDWASRERQLRAWFHDGLPIPVARLGAVSQIPWVVHDEEGAADADRVTLDQLRHQTWGQWRSWHPTEADMQTSLAWATKVEDRANSLYHDLLQDAPTLRLVLYDIRDWPAGPLAWGVPSEKAASGMIPVSELSTAEGRWARLAIRLATVAPDISGPDEYPFMFTWRKNLSPRQLMGIRDGFIDQWGELARRGPVHGGEPAEMQVVIIDEPESALHRSAERYMARGLDALAMSGRQVVVATHSPEILNRPEISLAHVSRDTRGGLATVSQMDQRDLTRATTDLGLAPSDLIGLHRVFLLVEGEHDEIVVETLLGDAVEGARVKIVPMRGGAKLPTTVESQLMFDMTTAYVVALLDNVTRQRLDEVWEEAQERYLTTGPDEAIAFLTAATLHFKGEEFKWIAQWLARALKKGIGSRVVPFGLMAGDIIEYLPVEVIAPRAGKDWHALRAEHEEAKAHLDKSKGLHDFKIWLQRTYRANVTPANIRTASQAVGDIPEELRALGYRLREISSR